MKFAAKFLLIAITFFSCSLCSIWGKNRNAKNSVDINDWSHADKKLATSLIDIYHKTKTAEQSFLSHFENSQQMFHEIKKENAVSPSDQTELQTGKEGREGKEDMLHQDTLQNSTESNIKESKLNSSLTSPPPSSPSPSPSPSSSTPLKSTSRFIQLKSKGPVEEETIWRAIYATQLRRTPPTSNVNVYSQENIEKEFDQAKMAAYDSEIKRMKTQFAKNLNYMSEELVRQKKIKDALKETLLLEEIIRNLEKKKKIFKGPVMRGTNATKTEC